MGQLSSLVNFALTPVGLALALIGILVFATARANAWIPWLVLSGLIFAASLNRFTDAWHPDPVRFWGPIDTLVGNGRPLTILLLGFSLILPARYPRMRTSLKPFAQAFLIVQMLLVLKILIGGSMGFAALSVVTTGLVFFLLSQIGTRWIQTEDDIDRAIVSLAAAAAVFAMVNAIQYAFGSNALALANGRFNGTTGNPQHAAVFLGVGVPALIYVALTRGLVLKLAASGTAVLAAYFLLWTGSRTGLVVATATTMLLLRRSGPTVIAGFSLVALGGAYWLLTGSSSDIPLDRFSSISDTRSDVWLAMWRSFEDNPLFGTSMMGDRLGFGENSWLAMAANTGIVGLIPLLIGGCLLLTLARQLLFGRPTNSGAQLQGDFLGGGIIALLIGSLFEAYLLSSLSTSMIMLLLIGTTGSRRLALNTAAQRARLRSRWLNTDLKRPISGGPIPR